MPWQWRPERAGTEKTDPMGAEPGTYYTEFRVLRGGSFYRRAREVMGRTESNHRPGYANFEVGFRVVRLAEGD